MRKGYNETASQILAEQDIQRQDRALTIAAGIAAAAITAGPLSVILGTEVITRYGGLAKVKYTIEQKITDKIMSIAGNTAMSAVTDAAMQATTDAALKDMAKELAKTLKK